MFKLTKLLTVVVVSSALLSRKYTGLVWFTSDKKLISGSRTGA